MKEGWYRKYGDLLRTGKKDNQIQWLEWSYLLVSKTLKILWAREKREPLDAFWAGISMWDKTSVLVHPTGENLINVLNWMKTTYLHWQVLFMQQ